MIRPIDVRAADRWARLASRLTMAAGIGLIVGVITSWRAAVTVTIAAVVVARLTYLAYGQAVGG